MSELVSVAKVNAIEEGKSIAVDAGGKKVALFNVGGTIYAIDNTCPHKGGPLSEGTLEGTQVTCPWHGAKFDLQSGKVLKPPARNDVACYKVVVEGDEIKIEVP